MSLLQPRRYMPSAQAAMETEVEVLSSVRHPSMIRMLHKVVNDAGKLLGYTMPLAEGQTIEELMLERKQT